MNSTSNSSPFPFLHLEKNWKGKHLCDINILPRSRLTARGWKRKWKEFASGASVSCSMRKSQCCVLVLHLSVHCGFVSGLYVKDSHKFVLRVYLFLMRTYLKIIWWLNSFLMRKCWQILFYLVAKFFLPIICGGKCAHVHKGTFSTKLYCGVFLDLYIHPWTIKHLHIL